MSVRFCTLSQIGVLIMSGVLCILRVLARRFSTGTEESLHCETEDEIVLPVLFIAGPTQCDRSLDPTPGQLRPSQNRVL